MRSKNLYVPQPSLMPRSLHTIACCDQMRDAERIRDVAPGRSEPHDFDGIRGLDS